MQTKKIIGIALAAALVGSMAAVAATSVSAVDSVDADFSLEGHSVGIIGGFNSWGSDIAEMTDADGDGVYVGVVNNVAAGDTEFKIRLDGAWDYSWGVYEPDYERTFNSQTNCSISTTETSDLVVVFDTNGADGNLWPVGYFTLDNKGGDAANLDISAHTLGVIGGFNDWTGDVEMTELTDGIYYANIGDLAANTEFKVRADGGWDLSWGAYEADYDRTQNSQTNAAVPEDAKNVTVFLNTNGDDFELWDLVFFYTNADGAIVSSNTGKDGSTPDSQESQASEPVSTASEVSTESSDESSEVSKLTDYTTQISDYIFFDNSETKWETVKAYWWNTDFTKIIDLEGNLYGSVKDGAQDFATGFPGETMQQIPGTDIWQARVPFGATKIIFDSGKTDEEVKNGTIAYQTADLAFDSTANAGQIYKIDTSVEAVAGRGVEKTKYRYSAGAWSAYTGEYVSETFKANNLTPDPAGQAAAAAAGGNNSTASTASSNTTAAGTTTSNSTTTVTAKGDSVATGDSTMPVVFAGVAAAALGVAVLASKKKKVEE